MADLTSYNDWHCADYADLATMHMDAAAANEAAAHLADEDWQIVRTMAFDPDTSDDMDDEGADEREQVQAAYIFRLAAEWHKKMAARAKNIAGKAVPNGE
jgi:hypothetical protein